MKETLLQKIGITVMFVLFLVIIIWGLPMAPQIWKTITS